jgi:membrane-associated phospholipid phosphatase
VTARMRVFAFVLPSACVFLFAAVASNVNAGKETSWDLSIVGHLSHRIPGSVQIVAPLALLAPCIAVVAVIAQLATKRFREAYFWVLAIGGVALLDPLLKSIFRREPLNEGSRGYSFPSGSAMMSLAVLIALILTFPAARRWIVLAGTALVIAQGAILVSARWHYPSDVVAGWSAAVVWVGVIWAITSTGPRRNQAVAPGVVAQVPPEPGSMDRLAE